MDTSTDTLNKSSRALNVWLLIASLIGLFAAAKLVLEKISFYQQKADGSAPVLGCDINPIIGCGNIINTEQASIFWNIPNPIIGVIAFSALLTISVLLLSGIRLHEWMWAGIQAGVVFGIAIVTYLQYSSIYSIHALCPYCMVVWAIMIPTFWVVTTRNLRTWFPEKMFSKIFYEWTILWLALHLIALLACIWFQFGSDLWA